ncbi:MAG TPA: enolase C-terminal domain-like protein [Thermomicrobiales bacterium]|nr:enolase C-terminal domain-like protein [Thermomicrobiales bacterium]
MKITAVETEVSERPVPHQFRWRAGLPGSGTTLTSTKLTIRTDEGLTGVAHGARGAILVDLVDRRLRDVFIGADPLLKEELWHRVWEIDRIEELPIYALGLADIALWDLTAKVAGLPLYKVIGGYRDKIPAYASTVTFESIEEYLDVADQCLDYGFTAIKLHAWGDARKDARLGEALRAHVGPDVPLMYDGSAGFDYVDSLYLGRALEDADFLWYEEPMREFNIDAYRRLAEKLTIPLLVAETSDGAHYNAADFIAVGAAGMLRTSTHFKGGVTGGLRIAHLAESFNLRAEVHGGGPPNLHLACAIPNTTYYESLVTSNPIAVEKGIGRDGMIGPPQTPGIGWPEDAPVAAKPASQQA